MRNCQDINPLNAKLNPIYPLLALLGAHHILHVSRIRVKIRYSPDASISNYVVQIPSLEADSSSASQEIPQDPATCPCPKPPMAMIAFVPCT